jgi:hypothetical protein
VKEEIMSNTSRTNWAKIDAMTDEDIETSDIPPLTDEFFAKAELWTPKISPKLVAAARQAKLDIAEGKSVPMDFDRL